MHEAASTDGFIAPIRRPKVDNIRSAAQTASKHLMPLDLHVCKGSLTRN